MLGIIIAIILVIGILWTQLVKMLIEAKEWIVFWIMEISLWLAENWGWLVCTVIWIALWVYLIICLP